MGTGLEIVLSECAGCGATEDEATIALSPTGILLCTDAMGCWERRGAEGDDEERANG